MLPLTDADFTRLYTYIKTHYGIDLSKKKQLISSRLTNMLIHDGYQSFSQYTDEIISGRHPEMISAMLDRLTTNYTYFLREKEHFNFLKQTVLPELARFRPLPVHLERRLFFRGRTLYHFHVSEGIFFRASRKLGYPHPGHGHFPGYPGIGPQSLLQF